MSLPFRSPPARQRAPCSAARAEAMRDGATGLKKPRSGLQCVSFEMPALPAVRSHGKPEPYSACDASTASTGQSLSSERQRLESGGSLSYSSRPPLLSLTSARIHAGGRVPGPPLRPGGPPRRAARPPPPRLHRVAPAWAGRPLHGGGGGGGLNRRLWPVGSKTRKSVDPDQRAVPAIDLNQTATEPRSLRLHLSPAGCGCELLV
jgi:hypothetical protein